MKANSYFDFNARKTNDVPLDTVDWTPTTLPPPDDSYVVRELTREQWADLLRRYREGML